MLAGYDHLLAAGRRLQWDAEAVDLRGDAAAMPAVAPADRDALRRLVGGFCVAERAVAEHLEPYVDASAPGVVRDCFALQAGDERRHARFFARVAHEVLGLDPGAEAERLASPALLELFAVRLPAAAAALRGAGSDGAAPEDPARTGSAALGPAVGLYHLVLEGIVFAVGQGALLELLDRVAVLPGVRAGVARVQRDERWHVGLGVLALHDDAPDPEVVEQHARVAARAWGPEVATPAQVQAALRAHRRRLVLLRRAVAA